VVRCWVWLLVVGATLSGFGAPGAAESWDRIRRYADLIRQAGTQTLVASDCPPALMGAFHAGRNALLLCANNLANDPLQIWTVLAHESAHVMQDCHQGPLLAEHQLGAARERIREASSQTLRELRLYHPSQHQEELEARLLQGMPADEVESLFRRFCSERLIRR
jgi:hypothetical protein